MKEQLTYFISAVFLLPFLPLLAWQGSRLKKRIPSIGEAAGPRTGIYEGAKPPLRLLALGESTFAGVGVDQQQDAITSIIGKTLQEQSGRTVEWNVIARSGYNAKQVLERLVPKIPAQDYDFIVIGLGGNDTFELNRPLRWKQQMTELVEQLNNEFPNSKIVIANLPPVGDFPAFPKSFQLLLGGLVRLHASVISDLPHCIANTHYINRLFTLDAWNDRIEGDVSSADLFSDGVHPSALTYRLWGEDIGEYCAGLLKT
jgi:lysophospholipase L1-like esterase